MNSHTDIHVKCLNKKNKAKWHCFLCGLKGRALGYILKTKCILYEFLSAHFELTVHCEDVSTPKQQTQGKELHIQFSVVTENRRGLQSV